jgi:hypothetical protein
MTPFTSFADIIEQWPSLKDFAADICIDAAYARTLKMRDALPCGYWNRVAAAAKKRGFRGITVKTFADISAAKIELESLGNEGVNKK